MVGSWLAVFQISLNSQIFMDLSLLGYQWKEIHHKPTSGGFVSFILLNSQPFNRYRHFYNSSCTKSYMKICQPPSNHFRYALQIYWKTANHGPTIDEVKKHWTFFWKTTNHHPTLTERLSLEVEKLPTMTQPLLK